MIELLEAFVDLRSVTELVFVEKVQLDVDIGHLVREFLVNLHQGFVSCCPVLSLALLKLLDKLVEANDNIGLLCCLEDGPVLWDRYIFTWTFRVLWDWL